MKKNLQEFERELTEMVEKYGEKTEVTLNAEIITNLKSQLETKRKQDYVDWKEEVIFKSKKAKVINFKELEEKVYHSLKTIGQEKFTSETPPEYIKKKAKDLFKVLKKSFEQDSKKIKKLMAVLDRETSPLRRRIFQNNVLLETLLIKGKKEERLEESKPIIEEAIGLMEETLLAQKKYHNFYTFSMNFVRLD